MRVFIAIDIIEDIKKQLGTIEEKLKPLAMKAKWVNPDNLHLTLKFLGELEENKLLVIKDKLTKIIEKFPTINLVLENFGFFPNQHKPRVFYISCKEDSNLKGLVNQIEAELIEEGFTKEDKFKEHITLARFKDKNDLADLLQELEKIKLTGSFIVNDITVFKSTLSSLGPIYQALFRIPLKS